MSFHVFEQQFELDKVMRGRLLSYAHEAKPLGDHMDFVDFSNRMVRCISEVSGMPVYEWRESRGLLSPGGSVNHHRHPEWTALFYVNVCDHPVCIEGHMITPEPGDIIVLEPNVEHWVDDYPGPETRCVFALLVEDQDGSD